VKRLEDLNVEIYERASAEQSKFKEWLMTQLPEEILNHAYEYSTREDILMALEEYEFNREQAEAILGKESVLDAIYHEFGKVETEHMTDIRDCIGNYADETAKRQIPDVPVYRESAAYAREHGELNKFRASMKVNEMCRTAIENAINDNYRDNILNTKGVDDVSWLYGNERVLYVLAATVQKKSWDGRISEKNKEWANAYLGGKPNVDDECRFYINNAHPGLVDLFVNAARKELDRKPSVLEKLNKKPEKPPLRPLDPLEL